MKKVLLGTTALVAAGMMASSPVLAAEKLSAKVGGYMEQWIGYASVDDGAGRDLDGVDIKSDSEIHFTGMTTLDNGIEFGVNVQLEANSDSGDQIDESYLIVKGSFGEINLGDENSAMYKMHYSPTDYGITLNSGDQGDWSGIGAAGTPTASGYFRAPYGSTYVEPGAANDSTKLTYYTPRFGGFQLGASYSPDATQDNNATPDRDTTFSDMVALGANFKGEFGGASIGVSGGYGTFLNAPSGSNEPEAYNVGATVGFAGFEVGGSYAKFKDSGANNGDGWNVGVSYTTGPLGVSLNYFTGEHQGLGTIGNPESEQDAIHLSANYTLGPGVTAAATLGHAEFTSSTTGVGDNEATYLVTGIKLSF